MTKYAAQTSVSSDASRTEIERTLKRYGATQFVYGWEPTRAQVGFTIDGRSVRFAIAMPDPRSREFTHTPSRQQRRSEDGRAEAYEQAVRQRWRALALVIKAKLEAVEAGITTVESEFLAHTVLPSGATVGEWLGPQLAEVYARNEMPALLAAPNGGAK